MQSPDVIYPSLPADGVVVHPGQPGASAPVWQPLDFSAGVESDPNNYGSVVGDDTGLVTWTVAAALGATASLAITGSGTSRPCALDIPAPADWDPATEDLWIRVDPIDVDLGSNKRLGVACSMLHSGTATHGPGVYESGSGTLSGVILQAAGVAATQSIGAALPDYVDGHSHLFARGGAWQMPMLAHFETAAPSSNSGTIGSVVGSTGLTTVLASWSIRASLVHGGGGTAVAGGEQVSARFYYARVPRPTGP